MECGFVKGSKLANMWHPDEDNDGYSSGILSQTESYVSVEERLPALGSGEEYGQQHCSTGADDGVEEGCKR
jgi:hypothetical protein